MRVVASIAVAAASLVAPAAAYGAVPEKAEQNITFSIPTSLRCAVKADGTVIAPSGWSMSNSGSGKVEITGVSVSNAIGKLKLSGKSGTVGYAVGEGSGSYAVSYDAADGCKFSSTSNRPLGIEPGKSLSWNWNIGKLNASDHRAALDSAASGMARLCDMSFSYASVGNSLSSEGTTGSMSGAVNSQSSSIMPVGGTATANVGNAPSNASLSYQWYTIDSNGSYSAIANANGKTLKVLAAYRGKDIVCRVSDSSGHYSGYVETARKPVRNLIPNVGISGSAVYGSKLTASISGLPPGATYTYKYRWQRLSGSAWTDIANATAAEYTLGGDDVGKQVRVVVSTASNIYTVDDVTTVSATVAKAKVSISVSISGTKNNSSKLTASVSGLPGAGANTVSYRWQRSSDGKSNWVDSTASDAKSNSIQMQPNDVSWHYRCIVSATNPYYDIASATSAAYGPIAKSTVSAARATISGNAVYGGTIKANVTNVPTVGTNSISYQWQHSDDGKAWTDTNLTGCTTSSITLSAGSCIGKYYRCVISVDSSYYIVPGCTTDGVKIGKASATVNAAISGTAAVGGKLSCSVSGLPTSGSNSVSYQWQYSNDNRTWTNSTYTDAKTSAHSLGYKDAYNLYWRCAVSVSNQYYNVPTAYTDSRLCEKGTASITASISGNAVISGKLTCSVGGLPSIGTNSVRYKWQYSSDGKAWTDSTNADASSNSITLPPDSATLGKYFRCVASATNDVYNDMSATSAAYGPIGKGSHSAPSVSISGSKAYGSTLTANVSGQPTGTTSTTYQWQRNSGTNGTWENILNATGKTYVLTGNDINHSLRVLVNTSNTYYEVPQGISATYGTIVKANKTISASVSGTKNNTSKLTVSVGGLPSVGTNTVSYQWQWSSDGSTGWTNSTYSDGKSNEIQMKEADVTYYYRCIITVSGNAYYNVNGATSAAYGPIGKSSHSAPSVSISGEKVYGATLTANVSGQPTGTTSTTYQWQRATSASGSYSNIANATGKTYVAAADDMNHYLRVLVNTANTYYNVSQGVSAGYGPIGKASHSAPSVSVSGDKTVGATLTASVSGQPDGTTTTTYQWQRASSANGSYSNISGATGKTYKTVDDDANKYMRVLVNTANTYYTVSQGVSEGYGAITLEAFAVYSADDNSLDFYKRAIPTVGETFNGKTATAVYMGIEENSYNYNNVPWKDYQSMISNSAVVDNNIAPISTSFWFADCSNLTSINFSNLNVNNVTNISFMFSDCSSLSSINLSSWNVANVTNMRRMFQSCSSLSSINLSSWNVGNVTNMNGMFFDCSSLASVGNLSSWNTSNVINMNSMFYNCLSLTTLDVSNFDTSNVTDMAFMFAGSGSPTFYMKLKNIVGLSGWNTSKVTSMASMFQNCASLTSVGNLSNWKTGNVTDMNGMFANCSSLSSINLSSWNVANVTNMRRMFQSCSSLSSINLSSWNVGNVTNMHGMFFNCSSLASVGSFSNWNTSKVTNMYGMFYNCLSLTTLDVSNFDTSNVTDMAFMFAGSGSSTSYMKLKNIGNLSGWNTSKVTSMASMFQKCSSLTSVGNLSNWETGNVTSMNGMFDYCSSLTSVGDLSNWNTGNVTSMRRMFIKCSSLTSVGNLAGWNTSKVITMNRMFFNCSSLVSVNLSNWDTSKVTDMYCMFYKCYLITSVGDLSKWNVSKVTTMNGMLGNCQVLTSVGNLSSWNTSNVTDMNYTFQSCFKLIVDCSKWNVSKVTGYEEFNYKAPGVIAPKWVSSDEVTDEDSVITLNNESEIENKTFENTEQENDNNKVSGGAEAENKSVENIEQKDDNNKNITTELNDNIEESQIINHKLIEQKNQANDTINQSEDAYKYSTVS